MKNERMNLPQVLKFFVIITSVLLSNQMMGQNPSLNSATKGNAKITGKIVDSSNKESVPYATIALTNPGSDKPLDGTVADMNGDFIINKVAAGEYNLHIAFMGYETRILKDITISDKEDLELGVVQVNPSTQVLNEVTVEGQKTLFEEKVDRSVYNAENDPSNRGGDATDVLRKVPMLTVDLDGNVSLRGSQNIMVLINNRPSAITANSIADALKQIPSDMIKSVEVITSPSAKYDAEGTGGIINIITKKNAIDGYSLGLDSSVGLRGSNLGLNGSLRTGKMGFSLGGFGRYGYNVTGSFENQQQTIDQAGNVTLNTQYADNSNRFLFGRYQLGWDYDINKNNFINASIQYGARNRNTFQDNLLTRTYRNEMLVNSGLRNVNVADLSGTVDVNLNYTHTFKKLQQEFSILTQFSRNDRENNFVNNILNETNLLTENRLKNLNESINQESTIQLDYQNPIGKNQLVEMGGKNIFRQVTSDYQYYIAEGSEGAYMPIENSNLADVFNYNQNVTAGYISYTLTTPQQYSLKVGTRYEYTTINANFQSNEQVNIPSYGSMVPSVNLSKRLANNNTLKAAYNRRLQRPSLQFLNPNLMASNPLNVTIGNPDLEPEFTDNFELSYNTFIKNSSLSITSFMRNTSNSIQSVRDIIGDTIRTTFQNIGNEDAYGVSLFGNISLSNKFTLNGGTDIYYAVLNNNVPDPIYNANNQGIVMSYRLSGTYTLPKGWALQGFGFFRGNQVQLQGSQGGFGIYSLNLRKDFNNKKGSLGFGFENFLHSAFRIDSELNSPIITQNTTTLMNNRSVKVNFTYRIGKLKENYSRRRKSISNDDLKSGGGGADAQEGGGGSGPGAGGAGPAPGGRGPQRGGSPAGNGAPAAPGQGQVKPGGQAPGAGQWQKPADGSGGQEKKEIPGQNSEEAPADDAQKNQENTDAPQSEPEQKEVPNNSNN
ncbi:outer membrane beta-barrel family protein [soil metagenome]